MNEIVALTANEYATYLDDEVLAFIDETNSWYPVGTHEKSVAEQRRIYDAMCRAFFQGYPDGITAKDHKAGHVPVRHYQQTASDDAAVVLYAHGGGNVVGGLESHDDVCADICSVTGFDVVAVDYRLSPEFARADSVQDCLTALDWVRQTIARPIVLVGDSAGGFLTASVMVHQRTAKDIAGLVSIYGGFGPYGGTDSMVRHAYAPLLSAAEAQSYETHLAAANGDGREVLIAANAPDLGSFPPIFAAIAECDPISGQAIQFIENVKAAGGVAKAHIDLGLVHGHLRARTRSRKAADSFVRITDSIYEMGHRRFGA